MKVSFVIPNYNGEEILKKNLPKVIESAALYAKDTLHAVEIIVVDDCSKDRSVEVITKIFSSVSYPFFSTSMIRSTVNKGFSSTVNKGAGVATGEVLILLNTDVYPEKNHDFFSNALRSFDDPKIFAVGFMDKSIDSGKITLRGRGVGKWKRGFLLHRRGEVNTQNTLWVSGGSSAFRRSIWKELGGMNEMYNPFYWEDIDLSYRALKRGYKIIFEPKSVVVHEHDKGSIKKSRKPFAIQTISYRNQIFFVWLNATDPMLLISHVLWLPYHIINTVVKGDVAFSLGLFQAISQLPRVIKLRRNQHRGIKIEDKAVVAPFQGERVE